MRRVPKIAVIQVVNLLFAGVFAGFLVGVLVLEWSLRNFDAATYTQVRLVELVRLDDLAAFTLLPALATTAVLAVAAFRWREIQFFALTTAAFALLAAIVVLTLLVNVPINSDQLSWNPDSPPANWASVRDRWQLAHGARTIAALLAFAALSTARVLGSSRRDERSTPTATQAA